MDDVNYLNENDVVASVCAHLESCGYTIHSTCTTKQTGEDIVAVHPSTGERLSIEAKGATSAREHSARFGQPFDSAQIRVHVSEAVFKAVQVLSAATDAAPVVAGIALPATTYHHSMVRLVMPVLDRLQVRLFWVHADGKVTTGSPPPPS
ncbi:MAG: hypothetical protein JXA57_12875 [Armatimonadetes bacterium]|nr:hypothetical protein [Armatimonadota bacterium]